MLALDGTGPEAVHVDAPGNTFGPYRLIRPLGEGGMGIVWLGEQDSPIRRTVALKVVKPGTDSGVVLSRFASERQTLAILSHDHIAKVFDAGVTDDGRPYFVMEYVVGLPITSFADRAGMPVAARLQLFLQVCSAVQHAHQKGVLHRDLKPTNILVSDQDGRPVVKVIDFGIAKVIGQHVTGRTMATEFGVLVGTPDYMSPEQASLSESTVDTRTDIYSLGLVLYELLVGALPFDATELHERGVLEMLRVIREEEPKRLATRLTSRDSAVATEIAKTRHTDLGTLVRQLRGELEWITARALEKDPARRYAAASELGADVERHLKGEAVLAGPPSGLYRLRKLVRRHRAAAAAVAVVAIAISVGAVASTLSLVRALRAETETRRQLTASLVAQGMRKVEEFDPLTGLVYLTRALELETDPDRVRSHRIRIGETLQRSPRLVHLWRHEGAIHMMTLSSRGLAATGSTDGQVRIRDLETGQPRGVDFQQGGVIWDGEFSPDGATLAVASDDGRVKLWDHAAGTVLREFTHRSGVVDIAFSPDGALVAAICRDGSVSVWNVRSGALAFSGAHAGEGRRVKFSPSGTFMGTAGQDGARLWHVPSGLPSGPVFRHAGPGAIDVAFAKDERWLATGGWDQSARLWEIQTGQPAGAVMQHGADVTSVTFADESRLLVTTAMDATTRTWRVPDGTPVGTTRVSASIASGAEVSRNLMIASTTQGGPVDLWSLTGERAAPSLPHGGQVMALFDPSGRFLLTAGFEGLARVWDLAPAIAAPPRLAADEAGFYWSVVASPDSVSAAVSSGNAPERGAVRVFAVGTGAPITPAMRFWAVNIGVAFSPDGLRLVSAAGLDGVRVWDLRNGEPLTPPVKEDVPLRFASFAPNGETMVVGGGAEFTASGAVRIRSSSDASPRTESLRHGGYVQGAWFSPDGSRLVTVAEEIGANVKVWDVATGRLVWSVRHSDGVMAAAWSPDGASVLTGGFDSRVRWWSASSGSPQPATLKMMGTVTSLGLTHDGARIVAGTDGGSVQLAECAPAAQPLSVMSHRGLVYQSLFSADGTLALTAAGDRTARLWDGRTGEPLTPSLAAEGISRGAAFVDQGRSWAWTGGGVFVDELTVDARAPEELRILAERASARALSAAGSEVPLSADEVEARFAQSNGSPDRTAPPAPPDYYRAESRNQWRRLLFREVVDSIQPLRIRNVMQWPDRMRLVGAYAVLNQWQDALAELRTHHARWPAAPELIYMEAVALGRLGDHAASAQHCRAALDATRGTAHPERAYWAARACLLQPAVTEPDRASIEALIGIAYERFSSNLARPELKGAMLLRSDRPQEALTLLQSAVPPASAIRPAVLLVAAAAASSGRRADALKWLAAADRLPKPAAYSMMRPWLEAEADGLREEVLRALR